MSHNLERVKNLDLDGKRMIVAQEVGEDYIFFGCEGGALFSFNLTDMTRINKGSAQQPVTARMWLRDNIVLAG